MYSNFRNIQVYLPKECTRVSVNVSQIHTISSVSNSRRILLILCMSGWQVSIA